MTRLAILTSGGDAPGMNAAIRAATLIGLSKGLEVVGVERGYRGLIDGHFRPLVADNVTAILREGGTILGTSRCPAMHERSARDRARAQLAAAGVESLLVIGGNGSLTGALAISDPTECAEQLLRVLGIPASIDNDVGLTSLAIGVDTAMNTIVEACDKIADTATSHGRTFLIEVMGRDSGYLAMTSAIASGADMVLFPEADRSEDDLVESIVRAVMAVRKRAGRPKRVIAIKAEGVIVSTDRLKQKVDERIRQASGEPAGDVETRVTVLGHVVRGGRPSAFDRLLGSRLANVAVRALVAGETRKMVAWMPPVEVDPAAGQRSSADPYCWLIDLQTVLTETNRLLSRESQLARWRATVFDELGDVFLL
ncbi:MAG TPA: 6-phosphofructokinase [Kofleriaceae bacterium]|nr:6-phosphofructokinase [Kofleriaceae bacterium]